MKAFPHKATVLLLLGGYLFAVTVGGAFHSHSGPACGPASGELPDKGDCSCPHEVLSCSEPGNSPSDCAERLVDTAAGSCVGDPHCAICDFLAQSPIPAVGVARLASADVVCPVVLLAAVAWVGEIPATLWSRGPPSVA